MRIKACKDYRYTLSVYKSLESVEKPRAKALFQGYKLLEYIKAKRLVAVPMSQALASDIFVIITDNETHNCEYYIQQPKEDK